MEIGNKIFELRKKNNMSQEQLAFKMGVARQTISKWELSETSPDLYQAKKLSKIFNTSLDELTNNDIKDILITKASDTERLVKITIIFMKALIVLIIMAIIGIIALFTYFNVQVVGAELPLICIRNEIEYNYKIMVNDNAKKDIYEMKIIDFVTNDEEIKVDINDYKNALELIDYIKTFNNLNNGICE